jgi:hypothetical protein
MRTATTSALACLAALIGVVHAGCGSIEPAVPVDDEGEPIALPGPYDTWLQIRRVTPSSGAVSLRPTIELAFTDYVDPLTFTSYGVLTLQSGGIVVAGLAQYFMADRTIRWTPRQDLEPGFEYRLTLMESDIASMTGAPLLAPTRLPLFIADESLEAPTSVDGDDVTWADVAPVFEARCAPCHSDPQWGLPAMERGVLVTTRSSQVDAMLVRPFDPSRSYLMHKILPDYPARRFTVQPPPWDENSTSLEPETIRIIEAWIRQGAR